MNPPLTAKEIGHLWFEKVWNERNADLARELMAADAIGYLEGGLEVVGPEAFLAFQTSFLDAMPDIQINIEATLADDHDVCVQWSARASHSGPGLGLAPSGTQVDFRGVTWFQIADGKIVGGRDFWNKEALMQTLVAASNAVA
ncbi:MAG: ester cyclase [Luteolibacter sp.]